MYGTAGSVYSAVLSCLRPGVVVVFAGESAVDVGESGADAVLVTLQGLQVDGVGEVSGQEIVALVLESLAVLGQLGQWDA